MPSGKAGGSSKSGPTTYPEISDTSALELVGVGSTKGRRFRPRLRRTSGSSGTFYAVVAQVPLAS